MGGPTRQWSQDLRSTLRLVGVAGAAAATGGCGAALSWRGTGALPATGSALAGARTVEDGPTGAGVLLVVAVGMGARCATTWRWSDRSTEV